MHLHVLPSSFTLCLVGPAGKRESVSVMTGYLPHNDLFLGHCEANKSFEAQLSFPAFGDGLVKITEKPVFKEEQRRMWAGKHGARNRPRNASHGDGHTLRLYLRFDCLLSTCPCERGSGQLQCARNRIAQWLESVSTLEQCHTSIHEHICAPALVSKCYSPPREIRDPQRNEGVARDG